MASKVITIKDLAKRLDISVSTVSRALKDNPEISPQTRKKVQDLAKELGYKPNHIAVALKTSKSNTIGVVVPQIVSTFFSTVVKSIEEIADQNGYNVLVASSNETVEKEKKNIDIFLANRCDGIILSVSKATTSYEHIQKILDQGVPLVLFDRTIKELEVSKVVADDAIESCTTPHSSRSQKNRSIDRSRAALHWSESHERLFESHDDAPSRNQHRLHRQMQRFFSASCQRSNTAPFKYEKYSRCNLWN